MLRRFGYAGVALVAASGCATRGDPDTIVVREPYDAVLADLLGRQAETDAGLVRDSIAAPAERVRAALVTAFRDAGIPVEIENAATGQVANPQFRAGRQLAGTRLSQLLRCGETLTGSRADTDRVVMAVVSSVKPLGAGASLVETRVIALATDTSGTGGRSVCYSTGELERRLHDAVRKATQAGA
jgi:hypothetical protein